MEDLPDDAVVVRGGLFPNAEDVLDLILDALDDGDGPVLSVFAADPAAHGSVNSAISAACRGGQVPHRKVRVTQAGALRRLGFKLVQDSSDGQAECHYHVVFSGDPTIVEVQAFVDCFGDPIFNPAKGE